MSYIEENMDAIKSFEYDGENAVAQDAKANQQRIEMEKQLAAEAVTADPALNTPEGQTSVPGPGEKGNTNQTSSNSSEKFGATETKTNQETGEEEQVVRTYSENETLASVQKTADAAMDDPLLGSVAALGAGVVDTVTDVAGLLPWLKPADDWYDEHFGRDRSKNDLTKTVRDLSLIHI